MTSTKRETTAAILTALADDRVAMHVPGGTEGTIRVFVPGADDDTARKGARSVACKVFGGVAVGRTPAGKAHRAGETPGHLYVFAPVVKRTADDPTVTERAEAGAAIRAGQALRDSRTDAVTLLASLLGIGKREARAMLAASGQAKAKAKAPARRPDFLAPETPEGACEACRGYGVVRKAGARAGGAYKTRNGADTARKGGNAAPCPACKGKGKARRSA